ncbi:MAG: PD40 domain-containing protein [Candidatus Aminicenantes bacterium]|nr:PD40 domain-containing protein [Candidatus Aminicenantes bacterium]
MKHAPLSRYTALAAAALVAAALLPSTAGAQYFGRNKVQYKTFDFKILKTDHFDVYFYMDRAAADRAARMAERWYARYSRFFNHELKGRQPLILYASSNEFQQTTVLSGVIGEGTGGVTESLKRRIVLPFGASPAESDHVIGHELIHAFQYDIARGPQIGAGQGAAQGMALARLPLWLVEGMAEYMTIGPIDPNTAMWMRDAARRKDIPDIKKMANSYKYFPYRWGHALLSYIGGRWGDETIARIFSAAIRTGDIEPVMEKILGIKLKQLSADWKEAMIKSYEPLLAMTELEAKVAKPVVKGTETNVYNISPTLSPDGREFMYFSTRDLFSIDLFLGNPDTGKVIAKVTNTAVNARFESLLFINSAGAWDMEGRRYAFGAVSKGQPIINIYDVQTKKNAREIRLPQIGEVFYPTWSPDGKAIAFSGMTEGATNIFIYDMETDDLRKMTDDAFAALHPAWSPDGRAIAFMTDRFTSDPSILSVGGYELAVLDTATGEVRRVPTFDRGKKTNPQWSPDARSLYFISDANGISNIYRIDLDTEKIYQVTNLYTGVSGITAISPAFSVAQKSGRIMYSAYDEGRFSVYSIEAPEALAGTPTLAQFGDYRPAALPPMDRQPGLVLGLLRNPIFGLPESQEFPVTDYKPKLGLDLVTTPQVALGVDRFGTYGGGGITLYWSDMLGEHTVATMAQVNNRLQDSAALVAYQNSQKRLNWGAVLQRIPYVYGYYSYAEDYLFNEPALIEQEYLFRQVYYEGSGFLSYPFSQVQRLEFGAGARLIDFQSEVRTFAYSLYDSTILMNEKTSLPAPASIWYGFARGALVYDSAIFGATGPIIGQSYIVEASPMAGNMSYTSFMADYRRYFMPVKPFTLAFRMLHYGRYGKNADDDRLYPIYIGYDGLVRGYDYNTFDDYAEFDGPDAFDFNRLLGSKILIANAELRFPLFGLLKLGKGYYGFLPVDFVAFYDVGWAWQNNDKPSFLSGGGRKPVHSLGVGMRFNVFGYIILGVNYVKPFSRPNKDWHFEFSFQPGF